VSHEEVRLENMPLAEMVRRRVGHLLDQLGTHRVPDFYRLVLHEVEKALIEQALARSGGSKKIAAEILGIHRNTLRNRMKALAISPPVA
jgi:DNA-binding protein Fis